MHYSYCSYYQYKSSYDSFLTPVYPLNIPPETAVASVLLRDPEDLLPHRAGFPVGEAETEPRPTGQRRRDDDVTHRSVERPWDNQSEGSIGVLAEAADRGGGGGDGLEDGWGDS